MDVDKPRAHQLAFGIDGLVDTAIELPANVQDAIIFYNHHAVLENGMMPVLKTDHPATFYQRAH